MTPAEATARETQVWHEREIEFPAELSRAELTRRCAELIAEARETTAASEPKSRGRTSSHRLSKFFDHLLRALHRHMTRSWEAAGKGSPGSHCLVALGGYGRRELSLLSDIDVMFLVGDRAVAQDEFIKDILYVLYDLKIELGYSVRRIDDCVQVVGVDLESTTAMIESRLLAGSRPLFQHFHESFFRALQGRGRRWFLQTKFKEWNARREKYDKSVYLLEPNLKEGPGGLRDIHTVRWLLGFQRGSPDFGALTELGILSPAELKQYRNAEDFILRLRNLLHARSPRKNDVLDFESQIAITKRLGYSDSKTLHAAELMMRDYYSRAREVDRFSRRSFKVLLRSEKGSLGALIGGIGSRRIDKHHHSRNGAIYIADRYPDYLREDPSRIMNLFARARKLDMHVSEKTRDEIERIVPELGEDFRNDARCRKHFMEILDARTGVARTLRDMHDCGFLSAWIPEFEHVRCMVRMDHYHRYTVDEHLLHAVAAYERLNGDAGPGTAHAAKIAAQVTRSDLLNLTLLLHDVGKGFGRGHALRGGQIVQRIGERLDLPSADIDIIRFLVLSHLKFSHVTRSRDVDDPRVGREIATEMKDIERLRMLYVHSVCDLMAVSPDAWNEWKAGLYASAYEAGAATLAGREPVREPHPGSDEQMFERTRVYLETNWKERLPADESGREAMFEQLRRFLDDLPIRYLQSSDMDTLTRHFLLRREIDDKNLIQWDLTSGPGTSQITVCTADVPGSFAMICGALMARDINICSAQIHSTSDGYAINTFQVTDLTNRPLPEDFRLERLRTDLNQVMQGKRTIEDLLEKYTSGSRARKLPPVTDRPSEFRIDNDASPDYSILEIRTRDRHGLLFQLASLLSGQRLNIHRAILSTEAYGVIDVFYVTDLEYNKIHDEVRVRKLRKAVLEGLDGEGAADEEE